MGRRMQPIRKKEQLRDIEQTLAKRGDPQGRMTFLLWEVGIRTGMRISDMLQLRVGDLRDQLRYTYLPIKQRHKKGAHPITITIEPALRKILRARCAGLDDRDWLFASPEATPGGNRRPISRMTAYRYLHAIGPMCGLDEPVGCHTMRKTFGYHHYQSDHDVAVLQKWFYHSSPETTLIYIGVAEDNFRRMTDRTPFSSGDELDDLL